MARLLRTTAAWRISIWTTIAFGVGTAFAFAILYFIVAHGVWERSDAWLSGEAQVLAQVSADTPQDRLYNRIVREIAELATQEVPDERNALGQKLNSVFFLEEDSSGSRNTLWVGPSAESAFLTAIHRTTFTPGMPQSIHIDGWPDTFRVIARNENGHVVYLGLSNRGATYLLRTLTHRFLLLWGGTVVMGFLIAFWSAYRTLHRVERITETVERLGSKDLGERLPESANSDEIARLAKTFNRMLGRIQTSVTELRQVTDSVAHDLKSPVTSIRGTLESALSDESNDRWRDPVCEAIEGLDRLLNFLNTALDVAEGQAGALHLDRCAVDLSSVMLGVVDLYQPAFSERHYTVQLEVEQGVKVYADLGLLHRVLSNLLENELTHLPIGSKVALRLNSRDGSAEFTIEDNGPGFPKDVLQRSFERFVKGKDSPGHGLGLAFVGAVVHAHGGFAKISNRPAGGVFVRLSLPEKVAEVTKTVAAD